MPERRGVPPMTEEVAELLATLGVDGPPRPGGRRLGRAARRRSRPGVRRGRLREVLIASGVVAVLASPFAVAATGDALREGVRNGTAARETKIIARHAGA